MSKAKKKKRAVVRGPQLSLVAVEPKSWAKGRTIRMRFVERPNKVEGNPFFALRCPQGLIDAVERTAKKRKMPRTEWARAVLAKACGYELESES